MSIANEINRLQTSKADIKEQVNIDKDYINAGIDFIGSETVDDYDEKIQEMQEAYKAFIPVNTTNDTQIDAPKGGAIIGKTIKGNTTQDGTPTPSSPVPVNNVTGEQVVRVCGKNLFDGQLEAGEYENSTGEKKSTADRYRNANFISVAPNTTYTFSIDGVSQKYVVYEYNKSKIFIRFLALESGTFTTSANTEYINFRNYAADYTADFTSLQIQLEKGSSATTYEEYQDTTLYMNRNKNLLKITDISKTINGITFTENPDGSIHAEGTATDLAYYGTNTLLPILPSQRYRLSGCPEGGSLSSYYISIMLKNESGSGIGSFADIGDGLFGDFIAPDSARYMYAQILILSGTTINATFYPQLELGSEITPYKEYEPLQEGNYEINLGKNLYEGSQDFSGTWINSSSWSTADETYNGLVVKYRKDAWSGIMKEIDVKKNGVYTFSFFGKKSANGTTNVYLGGGVGATPSEASFNLTTEWQRFSITFIATTGGKIRARVENSNNDSNTYICGYQLEKNNIMTSYAPYFTPIELNKIGNYQDRIYKNDGKWYIEKNVLKLVVPNAVTGTLQNSNKRFYVNGSNLGSNNILRNTTFSQTYGLYCDILGEVTASQTWDGTQGISYDYNSSLDLGCMDFAINGLTTVTDYQNALKGKAIYVIANTPEYTLIENEDLIEQLEELIPLLEGQNNISVDGSIPVYMDLDYIVRADKYLIGNRREGK